MNRVDEKLIIQFRKFQDFLLRYHQADVLPDDMNYTNEAEKSVMTLSLVSFSFSTLLKVLP